MMVLLQEASRAKSYPMESLSSLSPLPNKDKIFKNLTSTPWNSKGTYFYFQDGPTLKCTPSTPWNSEGTYFHFQDGPTLKCVSFIAILSHFPTVKLTKASHSNRTRIDGVEGEHVCHLTALDLVMHTLTIEVCLNLALGLVTSCYAHKIVCWGLMPPINAPRVEVGVITQ